jgi:hypothetical protein
MVWRVAEGSPPKKRITPTYGEHGTRHWSIPYRGKHILRIGSGAYEHSPLPRGINPFESQDFTERGWVSDGALEFGVDYSGTLKNGNRWRWIGDRRYDAVSYFDVPPKAARYFDRIIETMCVDEP